MSAQLTIGRCRAAWMVAVTAAASSSYGQGDGTPVPPKPNVPDCIKKRPDGSIRPLSCPRTSCGNSATISGSDIEALDVRGIGVQDLLTHNFVILRGTLRNAGGGCRGLAEKLSLEMQDGVLVGVSGD